MLADSMDLASLVSRQSKNDGGRGSVLIKAFISFHLFGLFGTLIMLITAIFSRSTPRHSTWYSFTISWIISAISYTLLFWSGDLTGPPPPFTLCLVQSMMIYSVPSLTAGTTLGLVVQIWFLVRSVAKPTSKKAIGIPPMLLTALLAGPYFIYATFLISILVAGWRNPRIVRRASTGLYCSFKHTAPGRISTFIVVSIMVPTVVLEILICRALRQQWSHFKNLPYSLSMALRVAAFTFVGFLSIALSMVFLLMTHHGSELNIVISILPVSAVLVFGTQADLIRVWMFWKPKPPPPFTMEKPALPSTIQPSTPWRRSFVMDIHASKSTS